MNGEEQLYNSKEFFICQYVVIYDRNVIIVSRMYIINKSAKLYFKIINKIIMVIISLINGLTNHSESTDRSPNLSAPKEFLICQYVVIYYRNVIILSRMSQCRNKYN